MQLVATLFLEMIRELHDQNAVARHEADKGDQPDLTVDVDRWQTEEREEKQTGKRERHRAGENDERIAEALEPRREHEINQNCREQEHAEELAAFSAQMERLPV